MDEQMFMGDSTIIPIGGGWWKDTLTNNTISPDGKVFDEDGELVGVVTFKETADDDNSAT